MDWLYYGFGVLVFIAAALGIEAIWQWWFSSQSKAARRIGRRLSDLSVKKSADRQATPNRLLKDQRLSESAQVEKILVRVPGVYQLNDFLSQGGVTWNVARFAGYSVAGFFIGFLLGLIMTRTLFMGTVFGLLGGAAPSLVVMRKRSERLHGIERQLPEAADLVSRSLKAGHALTATLQMLADELPEPISSEFRQVSDEVSFGSPLNDALQRLAERVPLTDLRYMVVAILIQREAGGNLSEVMTNVSLLIRQRLKLMGDVKTMSAEGRLSAVILCMLPIAIAAVFAVISPDYLVSFWNDPAGPKMLGVALAMMIFGVLWMRMIVRIRV
jgi:tight adherence protein B